MTASAADGRAAEAFEEVADALGLAAAVIDRSGTIVSRSRRFAREVARDAGALTLGASADDPEQLAACLRTWFSTTATLPATLSIGGVQYRCDGARLGHSDRAVVRLTRRPDAVAPFRHLSDAVDLATLRRTTQRLEAALADLERSNAALSAVNEELDRFASVVSHDLRSPLMVIGGSVQLLQDTDTDAVERRALIEGIGRNAARLLAQIDGVLEAARAGAGPTGPAGPVRLDDVLRDVLDRLRLELEGARATLVIDAPSTVEVPEVELVQLFQNLVQNAVKFRRPDRPLRIQVRSRDDADRVIVEVSDNGTGIAQADRERVFDLFARATTDGEGSGVGLATCRRIVSRHAGRITVGESADGGATFHLDLPAAGRDRAGP